MAKRVLEFIAHFRIALGPEPTTTWVKCKGGPASSAAPKRRGRPRQQLPVPRRGHTLVAVDNAPGHFICNACGLSARSVKRRDLLACTECCGSRLARLRASAPPPIEDGSRQHALVDRGSLVFCATCGAYSFSRAAGLLRATCGGPPVSDSNRDVQRRLRRERLMNGLHPVTGKALA